MRPAALMRGPSAKPQVAGARPLARLRHVEQRGDARARAPRHHLQALADQRAVDARSAASRRTRSPAPPDRAAPIRSGSRARGEEALRGAARARWRRRSGRPPRRRRAAAGRSVQSSRFGLTVATIGGGGPSALWWSSTIDVGLARDERASASAGGGAAVDADDQAGAARHQRVQRRPVRAVALRHAVGHVVQHRAAKLRAAASTISAALHAPSTS